MDADSAAMVRVWDPLVRIFHWVLVAAFFTAYFTEFDEGVETVHEWAGYTVAGLVVFRLLWGLVGPKHARFGDFLYSPAAILGYLRDVIGRRSERYLGHSPAGGAMVVALLLSLAATTGTGMTTLAFEEGRGPLARLVAASDPAVPIRDGAERQQDRREGDEDDEDAKEGEQDERGEIFEELHEFFGNLTLILIIAHIGGVALASFAHRENLVRAMVTGRKRAP